MPVPDQVRDDGSGIQEGKDLLQRWIPACAELTNTTQRV